MHGSTVFLVAMFTSALTAAGTVYVVQRYNVLPAPQQHVETVTVPQLQGLAEADARKNAEAVKVALLVAGREPSETQAEGTVLRQSVPPGQQVPPNHPVSIVLAHEVVKVPEVTGMTVPDATLKLKEKGYELKAESVPSAEVEYGRIVEQEPAAGSELERGATVTVKASSGAQEVEVPRLVGMGHGAAKKKLEELGLEPKFSWVALAETASYSVVGQKPDPGKKLKPGESVTLVVNR